jgi:phosphoserine aminotransferase
MILPSFPKPADPYFASGHTVKRPGWSVANLSKALTGRSHRSVAGLERIREMLSYTRQILEIPTDYHVGLVAGSTTGAVEMALWNLLGARGVDSLAFDVFGHRWQYQLQHALKIADLRCLNAPEGLLPDLYQVDFNRDVVFLWNGSTSGVCMPHGDWIPDDRTGLTICDATSAVFAMKLPWKKLDVTAFSWQKGLGSEAAHGMLVLSPRAVERLESYQPPWPVPGLYRLREHGKLHKAIFEGLTTNTPSMLCIEDYLDALKWAEGIGGLNALIARSRHNLEVVKEGLAGLPWLQFLATDPTTYSSSTICLKMTSAGLSPPEQWSSIQGIAQILAKYHIAYDCLNHTSATPAFRLWGGPTMQSENLKYLLPWLTWAKDQLE